jgi:hypothetical protein
MEKEERCKCTMHQTAAASGLIDSQRWLDVARWLGIQKGQRPKANYALAAEKVRDKGSENVGAGNGVVATFDSPPQLAAEAKGSGGTEDEEGTRNLISTKP